MRKDGVKFGCLCADVHPSGDIRRIEAALPGEFFVESPWADVDVDAWREELGRWQVNEIKRANLWVWSVASTETPQIHDNENDRLFRRMNNFWIAFLMHEPPDVNSVWILTGDLIAGHPTIATLRKLPRAIRQSVSFPAPLSPDSLDQIAVIAGGVDAAEEAKSVAGRLERGFAAFVAGMQSDTIDDSILCFVRALEAIVQPNGGKQFCNRTARILQSSTMDVASLRALLEEIYKTRGAFTHAEAIETAFRGNTRDEAIRRGRELRAATHIMASRCYREVFARPDLIKFFSSEQGEFWGDVVSGKKEPPFRIPVEPAEWLAPD